MTAAEHPRPGRAARAAGRWLAVGLALAALAAALDVGARSAAAGSVEYCVAAEFEAVPATDRALTAWLRRQPGVAADTVCVSRTWAVPTRVMASFVHTRTVVDSPPVPDLDAACRALGYARPAAPFADADRAVTRLCCSDDWPPPNHNWPPPPR